MTGVWWTSALCLLAVVVMAASAKDYPKPNIIYLLGDDVGYGDYSWVDDTQITPRMEELRNKGRVMSQAYTLQACTPTRTALMTAKYGYKTGFQLGKLKGLSMRWVNTSHTLMPEYLQRYGYTTHAIGKWHLGYCHWDLTPRYRGFDTFYGFLGGEQGFFNHSKHSDNTFDFRDNGRIVWEAKNKYATTMHTDRALEIIGNRKAGDKPFFIYMSYQNAHAPFEADEPSLARCNHVKEPARKVHCGMMAAMDRSIGRIMDKVKKMGYWDDTIFVYSSDNGAPPQSPTKRTGSFSYPLRGGKGTFWEGGTRSDAIFTYGARVTPGTSWDGIFHVTDWYPTFVRAAGASHEDIQTMIESEKLDGMDQFDNLVDGQPGQRNKMVYGLDEYGGRYAVRIGNMKLIKGPSGSTKYGASWLVPPALEDAGIATTTLYEGDLPMERMYDLKADPYETTNLYNNTEYAGIQERLEKFIDAEFKKIIPFPTYEMPKSKKGKGQLFDGALAPGWCCPNCK